MILSTKERAILLHIAAITLNIWVILTIENSFMVATNCAILIYNIIMLNNWLGW